MKNVLSFYAGKIAIVVPTLNESAVIGTTLSKLRALLPDAELIVCDGGSKDDTVKIARKTADKVLLETVITGKRPSIGAGRNSGARSSKREWVVFCDADNVPPKAFFEKMAVAFQDASVVGFGGKVYPKDLSFIETIYFDFLNFIVQVSAWVGKPVIAGNAVAYKKKPFFSVNGFDEEMQASEDQDLCQRIAKKGRVVYDSSVVTQTSNRRLRKLGLIGLTLDWSRTSINFALGRKNKSYASFR